MPARIEHGRRVRRELRDGVGPRRHVRSSGPAVIEGDDLVAFREPGDGAMPAVGVGAEAHDEQDGSAGAVRLEVDSGPISCRDISRATHAYLFPSLTQSRGHPKGSPPYQ